MISRLMLPMLIFLSLSIQALVYVLEQLGDVHSSIYYRRRQYANYPDFDEASLARLRPLVSKSQEQSGQIKTATFGKYAYLQIPGIQAWGEQTNVYAQAISDSICQLDLPHIQGFILDLRLNGGGQLSSMLSGLNLLLGEGYLGGGLNHAGQEANRLEMIGLNLHINGRPMTDVQNKCQADLSRKALVVLIGPVTMSSGSIAAISFKHRSNTYFIGEPTAEGYSTGNDYFYLGPELSLNLSTHFSRDRKEEVYKNAVGPDLPVREGDDFEHLPSDKKIKAALEWLIRK